MRRSDPLSLAVSAAGAVAALLLIATEFATIASVDVTAPGESCETQIVDPEQRDRCALTGFDRHGGALILLGLLALLMAWGAGVGRSRPAAVALIAIGAIVLAIALAVDLPVTDDTGAVGRAFAGAEGRRGSGLYVEIVGGALAVAAGALRLRGPRRP